ncbi:MAG: hypothetical protein AAFQ37_11145, partial [Bacteroidota bacterium]
EIDQEIEKLQTDLVPEKELKLVRAYLLGGLITDIDGPLNIADRYQAAIIEDTSPDYFDRLADVVRHITATELRDLAQRYLGRNEWEVIVGGAGKLEEATEIKT